MTEFIITCESELQNDGSYKIKKYRELVRCIDCKHYNIIGCSEGFGWCERYGIGHTDDWFCAYGERGDDL